MAGLTAQKVIVPYDFSDEALAAVDRALEITGDATRVHVVHVLPELSPMEPGVMWRTVTDESRKRSVTEAIDEQLSDPKYQGVQVFVSIGNPGSEITEYARQEDADLIVIPSHGRRGVARMLIGSVAERVIRLARCPVLVLRR